MNVLSQCAFSNFILLNVFVLCQSSHILILAPFGSKSHKNFFNPVAMTLVENGHEVTIVTPFPASKIIPGLHDISLPAEHNIAEHVFKDLNVFEDGVANSVVQKMLLNAPFHCSDSLAQEKIQALKKQKFDFVILSMFFSDCFLSLVQEMKVPFAHISPANLHGLFATKAGTIVFPSLRPNKLLESRFPLNFADRFITTFVNSVIDILDHFYMHPKFETVCISRGLCSPDFSLDEIKYNSSLTIVNSIRTLEHPAYPSMPNIIYVGGIHCHPSKPLPKNLEEWANSSGDHGLIYFSMGSAIKYPSKMPERHLNTLLSVFGSLKQKVLLKWDKELMPNIPSNVKISKWLPQQDILGHPKLRLFISHGGLLSTQEAMYHGVPVLGMPLFADQHSNVADAVVEGWAKRIHWRDLTKESFRNVIQDCLDDKSMRRVISRMSTIMKDVPMHPKEDVKFWVEYVLRHNGADHIKSPFPQMKWYVIYNVDVWMALVVILLIILWIKCKIIALLWENCCYKERKQVPKKNPKI